MPGLDAIEHNLTIIGNVSVGDLAGIPINMALLFKIVFCATIFALGIYILLKKNGR
jgi:hypothetical protein